MTSSLDIVSLVYEKNDIMVTSYPPLSLLWKAKVVCREETCPDYNYTVYGYILPQECKCTQMKVCPNFNDNICTKMSQIYVDVPHVYLVLETAFKFTRSLDASVRTHTLFTNILCLCRLNVFGVKEMFMKTS